MVYENKDNRSYYSVLLGFYEGLLTDRQREIIGYSLDDDLSLSEIAELTGITRQGVRDAIAKAEAQLALYEEKLGMYKAYKKRLELGARLSQMIDELSPHDTEMRAIIKEICGELNV